MRHTSHFQSTFICRLVDLPNNATRPAVAENILQVRFFQFQVNSVNNTILVNSDPLTEVCLVYSCQKNNSPHSNPIGYHRVLLVFEFSRLNYYFGNNIKRHGTIA